MLEFLRRNRVQLASGLLLLVALLILVRASHDQDTATWPRRFFFEIMAPLQRGTVAAGHAIAYPFHAVAELYRAREENATLRANLQELQRDADRLTEVSLENARLRELLAFRQSLRGNLLTARVIGRDATGIARTLLIDRGEADGVNKGAAALAPAGIVGQVLLASRHAARILLIADHNSGVDAIVQRTRARGIVEGAIDGGCGLKYVKRTEDVQVNDEVVTSGLDGIFPKGLPIGAVTAVNKRAQGLFQYAEIQPRVDFDQLEELLVTLGPVVPVDAPPQPGS
jgi:rod shape-determining protein MreC